MFYRFNLFLQFRHTALYMKILFKESANVFDQMSIAERFCHPADVKVVIRRCRQWRHSNIGRQICKRENFVPFVPLLTFKQGTHKRLVFCTNSEKKTITFLHNCIRVEKLQFCTKVGVSSFLIVVDDKKKFLLSRKEKFWPRGSRIIVTW